MVSTCLIWCILREMNEKSLEDHEWTLEEFKLYSSTVFSWTASMDFDLNYFHDSRAAFSFSKWVSYCISPLYLNCLLHI